MSSCSLPCPVLSTYLWLSCCSRATCHMTTLMFPYKDTLVAFFSRYLWKSAASLSRMLAGGGLFSLVCVSGWPRVNPSPRQCYWAPVSSNLIVLNSFPEIMEAREVGHQCFKGGKKKSGVMKLLVPGKLLVLLWSGPAERGYMRALVLCYCKAAGAEGL